MVPRKTALSVKCDKPFLKGEEPDEKRIMTIFPDCSVHGSGNYTQFIEHSQHIEHDRIHMKSSRKRKICMITYDPLWKTLNDRNMSTYDLIYKHGLSANTIHRIKNGKAITTTTLNELCFILKCAVSDLIEYRESEED